MTFLIRAKNNHEYTPEEKYINRIIEIIKSESEKISPESDDPENVENVENINNIMNAIIKIINERKNDDKIEINRVKNDIKNYVIRNEKKLVTFDKLRNNFVEKIKNGPDEHRKSQWIDVNIEELYWLKTGNIAEAIWKFIETIYGYITNNREDTANLETWEQLIKELIASIILQDWFEKKRETIEELLNQANKSKEIANVIKN